MKRDGSEQLDVAIAYSIFIGQTHNSNLSQFNIYTV
jgi:hypothetical protein